MSSRRSPDGTATSPISSLSSPEARSTSPAQNTQQEVAQSSWHVLMWIPLIFLFPAAIISTTYVVEMVQERTAYMKSHPEKYKWDYPALGDLTTTGYSLIVLLVARVTLCKHVFTPLGDWILPSLAEKKGKWTAAAREDRVQRFSVCMFKLIYFCAISIWGYITLKDVSWLPPQLFGSGDVSRAWDEWPYSEVTDSVKTYYLVELSYHAHSLVFHLFTIHRNDFVEMTLHHTCAILLVVFSYYANFVRIGVLVLFLHDIADVMAYAVKAVVDTKYTVATLSCYAGLLIAWGYTRLYVFPVHVIAGCQIPGVELGLVWYTSFFMVWLLLFLHVYWYILFLIMGYRFLISGKTVDIQQKAGESDGSYKDYHKKHVDEDAADEALAESMRKAGAATATNAEELERMNATQQQLDENGEDEDGELSPSTIKPRAVRTRSQKKSSRRAE